MTAVRHTTSMQARVLELHEAGWKPAGIERLLAKESPGVPTPTRQTVWRWTHPEEAEARVAKRRAAEAKYTGGWPGICSPEWKQQRMRAMRSAGLSYNAIATIMRLDFPRDAPMTEHQVRYLIRKRDTACGQAPATDCPEAAAA